MCFFSVINTAKHPIPLEGGNTMDKEIKEKLHIEKVVNTGRLYPMKEACEQTGLAYETLKFYCNIGLVPGVKRDARNRRVFNDKDISWIKSLTCLKNCDMSIEEMKEYLALCLKGQSTIPERKEMLMKKRAILIKSIAKSRPPLNISTLNRIFMMKY